MKTFVLNLLIVGVITGTLCGFATAQKPTRTTGPNFARPEFTSSTISDFFRVFPGRVQTHSFYLTAGTDVDVELYGDGDTDLDMYIYDSGGNLISSRTTSSDVETSELEIYRSGYFTIKVVNRGSVYNDYRLFVRSY